MGKGRKRREEEEEEEREKLGTDWSEKGFSFSIWGGNKSVHCGRTGVLFIREEGRNSLVDLKHFFNMFLGFWGWIRVFKF